MLLNLQDVRPPSPDNIRLSEEFSGQCEVSTIDRTPHSAQFQSRRSSFEKAKAPRLDPATITQRLLDEFEQIWFDWNQRRNVLPGKEFLATLNRYLQERYKVTLTPAAIIGAMRADEVPDEMHALIDGLEQFRTQQ